MSLPVRAEVSRNEREEILAKLLQCEKKEISVREIYNAFIL